MRIFGSKDDILYSGSNIFFPVQISVIEIPLMNEPYDIIDFIFVNGQTRISIFAESTHNLVHGAVIFDRHHIHAGNEDILDLQIVKFQRRAHQFGFILFQGTVLLGLFDERNQFCIRHRVVRFQLKNFRQKFLIAAEDKADRR